MSVAFTINYFLVGGNVPINNETFLMTDFVNLKIKPTQSFRDAHRDMMYICVFIRLSKHIYIYLYLCFLKKKVMFTVLSCAAGGDDKYPTQQPERREPNKSKRAFFHDITHTPQLH
jgi:hypothetical protein